MTYQEKIDQIKNKYGNKCFSYTRADLKRFTDKEIKMLIKDGLIEDIEISIRVLNH